MIQKMWEAMNIAYKRVDWKGNETETPKYARYASRLVSPY